MLEHANVAEAWEAEERRRELEAEAWKVAQLAATIMAGYLADPNVGEVDHEHVVASASSILSVARKKVAERGVRPTEATR